MSTRSPRAQPHKTPPPATAPLVPPLVPKAARKAPREETPRWARNAPSAGGAHGTDGSASRAAGRGESTPLFSPTGSPTSGLAGVAPPTGTSRPAGGSHHSGAPGSPSRPRTAWVRSALWVRKLSRRVTGPAIALGLCAVFAWVEGKRLAPGDGSSVLLVGALLGGFGARLIYRLLSKVRPVGLGAVGLGSSRAQAASPRNAVSAFDLEVSLLAALGALLCSAHLPGALDGAGFALVYAAVAIVSTFATRAVTVTTTLVTIATEVGVRVVAGDPGLARFVPIHAAVLSGFAVLNSLVLRGRIERISVRARLRVEREVERMRDQARSYRLLDTTTSADASGATRAAPIDAERAARSSVEEIQIAVRFALDLLKRSLGAHSAVLLFESTKTRERGAEGKPVLRLAEVVTDAKAIAEGPYGMGDGVLGAVMRKRAPVALHGLRAGYRVPWYPLPLVEGSVSSLLAVPIVEAGVVRGVLCVDRLPAAGTGQAPPEDRPFTAHEEELSVAAARYVLRAIENERVFGRLERAKAEQDQLYAAAQRLSGALTEAEVIEAGVESARAIAAFDLAAITVVHEADGGGPRTHEVRAVAGAADFDALVGLRFGDNGGLVAQAVKSRCSLPHRGDHDPATQVVFTRRHPLRIEVQEEEGEPRASEVRSILVVPLTLRDRPLGTLVLGARRRGAFRDFSGSGARTTLEVLATHIATSLANARMFAKLEELATTDGLTGLLNKRVLLELGTQKVRAAARYGKPLSVIQTDIDHFKHVNDTYGHDVGDQVIKGLAGILRRLKRGTDYVARFGGEEFVIVCEETDAAGAFQLAERVREELARTTFHTSAGPFAVTCSLGVATFPGDGATWDSLYKATDDALYASKRGGRNRTTVASEHRLSLTAG